jgi:endonuclease/exonuclease/phosphatase (EEP) superfamily protein YafD
MSYLQTFLKLGRLPLIARRLLIATGMAYVATILSYAGLRRAAGPRPGWAELVDDLEPWTYLPAPVLFGLGLVLRSQRLALAAVGLAAMFGLRWGPRYLRTTPDSARYAADLKVMTFNTLAWQRAGNDLADSIRQADPDIVGLQEIGPRATEHIADVLGDRYPYRFLTPSPDSSGAAVFSSYPIRASRSFRGSERGHWWQMLQIDTPFGPLTYLNLHTRIPYIRTWHRRLGPIRLPRSFHVERRQREIDTLMKLLDNVKGPLIVTGDFNMTERCADYDLVASRLCDAYRAVGRGLGHTFPRTGAGVKKVPAPWPILRLDYVWHSEHFEPAWAERGEAGHSDHHPIIVGLRWREPAISVVERSLPLVAQAI